MVRLQGMVPRSQSPPKLQRLNLEGFSDQTTAVLHDHGDDGAIPSVLSFCKNHFCGNLQHFARLDTGPNKVKCIKDICGNICSASLDKGPDKRRHSRRHAPELILHRKSYRRRNKTSQKKRQEGPKHMVHYSNKLISRSRE